MKKGKVISYIVACLSAVLLLSLCFIKYKKTGEIDTNYIEEAVSIIEKEISTYEMTNEEIEALPTTEIIEQTEEQEQATEQEANEETEGFQLQGDIAYEGAKAETWNVELGDYKGLTYYSQLDSRWSSKMFSSVNNSSQTIGSSGCGPTCASMIVTACKGTITPDTMADLFVKYGYRSTNNGTYFSAFRAVADEFDIEYKETYRLDDAVSLLQNNHYVIASCGNGLFTTGGHFVLLVRIDNDTIKIYDPYLYSGKFETSTRRGKVTVDGNTVYCSVENFREYANYTKFFAFKHDEEVPTNNTQPVIVQSYTRYVTAKIGLNIRNNPNGSIIGSYKYGTAVTVYETNGDWSRTDKGWVCSTYLSTSATNIITNNTVGTIKKLTKATTLYSNPNLTGTQYQYKANTTITILQNISSTVDKVKVNATGRIAYMNNENYGTISTGPSSVGKTRKINACILYSNSNLTGTKYTYKANTTVTILQNVNSYIDKVRVNATGRYAYINVNNYR